MSVIIIIIMIIIIIIIMIMIMIIIIIIIIITCHPICELSHQKLMLADRESYVAPKFEYLVYLVPFFKR